MKKEMIKDWIFVIAAIIAITAGIALFLISLCEETPWRLLFVDVAILATSALVMRVTSDGMNFSVDNELDVY